MRLQLLAAILLGTALAGGGAAAQTPMQHQGHGAGAPNDAAAAFTAANEKMMRDMGRKPTGDVDQDFVAGMIPHHQGAIDMARIVLKYSSDAELRKLASNIVAAQRKEIAQMRDWQARHPR
jgi:uncharacterized protein (DUF305 family)